MPARKLPLSAALPALFLALAALLVSTSAEASHTSGWGAVAAPQAPAALTRGGVASESSSVERALALGDNALEDPDDARAGSHGSLALFAGNELDAATRTHAPGFHLDGAALPVSPLASGDEPSYPKTRVRAFDFLGQEVIGVERELSLTLHWGSGVFGRELASGSGEWLSEDPAGTIDSPSLYAFVGNRPNLATDPLGLQGLGDWLKQKWTAARDWWAGLGSRSRRGVEAHLENYLPPAPDAAADPYGARQAFAELGLEGQYNRERAARAGAEVRRDAVRGAGFATQGAVEAGKFYAEGKALEVGLTAIGTISATGRGAARYLAGTASGGERLAPAGRSWFRGSAGNAGLVPRQVADKLRGRSFRDFDEFRGEFWRAVAGEADIAAGFSKQNVGRMKKGLAPIARDTQWVGEEGSYVLHHRQPIQQGGGVYDLDNILVATPRYHQEVLSSGYHYR